MERTLHSWPLGEGELAAHIRAFTWDHTPLGPISSWSASLKTTVQLVLDQSNPSCVIVGEDRIFIYNDAYAALLDYRHPSALGRNIYATFAEVDLAHHLEPAYAGKNVVLKDEHIPSMRQGVMDPAWFEVSYVPVREPTGAVFAVLILIQETTTRVLTDTGRADRRAQQSLLLNISDSLHVIKDPLQIQQVALQQLSRHLNVDSAFLFSAVRRHGDWIHVVVQEYKQAASTGEIAHNYQHALLDRLLNSLQRGEATAVDDLLTHSLFTEQQAHQFVNAHIRSLVVVPILQDGDYCGGLCIQDNVARHWTDENIALVREVAERTWRAAQRAQANASEAQELENAKQIVQLSSRLFATTSEVEASESILDVAMSIMRCDFACVHRLERERNQLKLVASKDFSPMAVTTLSAVSLDIAEIVGLSLTSQRANELRDTLDSSAESNALLRCFHDCRIRASYSVPMTTPDRKTIGVISVHWREQYSATDVQARSFATLAQLAANFYRRLSAQS